MGHQTESLYDGLNRGDKRSIFELFLRHSDSLRAFLHRHKNRYPEIVDATEDLLHDCLLKLIGRFDATNAEPQSVLDVGKFEPYFKTILERFCLDLLDKLRVRKSRPLDNSGTKTSSESPQLKSNDPSPSEIFSDRELIEQMNRLLLTLDVKDQELITRRNFGDSYESIADRLGIEHPSAMRAHSRALEKLRSKFIAALKQDGGTT